MDCSFMVSLSDIIFLPIFIVSPPHHLSPIFLSSFLCGIKKFWFSKLFDSPWLLLGKLLYTFFVVQHLVKITYFRELYFFWLLVRKCQKLGCLQKQVINCHFLSHLSWLKKFLFAFCKQKQISQFCMKKCQDLFSAFTF